MNDAVLKTDENSKKIWNRALPHMGHIKQEHILIFLLTLYFICYNLDCGSNFHTVQKEVNCVIVYTVDILCTWLDYI